MFFSKISWALWAFGGIIGLAACSPAANVQMPQPTITVQPTLAPVVAAATPQATRAPTATAPASFVAVQCNSPALATPSLTEGPYFKAGSPERTVLLEPGMKGTEFVLAGFVLTPDCKPIADARLDFWQADADGNYDNSGYRLRGHQFTDAAGRYQLTTVVPGLYPGRTEHIHVKVQPPNAPVLTTQLFFPGVANNQRDNIFDPSLVIQLQNGSSEMIGSFNFVVKTQSD